jgi:hypothetical protein
VIAAATPTARVCAAEAGGGRYPLCTVMAVMVTSVRPWWWNTLALLACMSKLLECMKLLLYKKSRHAANMKAVRVVQASVMMGCYYDMLAPHAQMLSV